MRDTGLRPWARGRAPVVQSLEDWSDEPEPHEPELESPEGSELEPQPPELESPEGSELEPQPPELPSSDDESLLLHASATAAHPSAAAGATSDADDPEPSDEPELAGGCDGADGPGWEIGGALSGGGDGAHVVVDPPAVTNGLWGTVGAIAIGTSAALDGVTIPSIRLTQMSLGESAATASAASSAAPQRSGSIGVPPSSAGEHDVGPGATASAPAGHADAKGSESLRVA